MDAFNSLTLRAANDFGSVLWAAEKDKHEKRHSRIPGNKSINDHSQVQLKAW